MPADDLQPAESMDAASVHSVMLKLPEFLETNVQNWFIVVEAQFTLRRIKTEKDKFLHVVSALPGSILEGLSPELLQTPDYERLKATLIDRFQKSKSEMFRKVLSSTSMTGRPSLYLQELVTVAGKIGISEELIKHQFLEAVPNSVSAVLISQRDNLSLEQLGKLADDVMVYHESYGSNVNAIFNHRGNAQHYTKYSGDPNKFPVSYRNSSVANNSVPISVRPYKPGQRTKICRAHIFFAENARTCKAWCKFPNKSTNVRMLPNSRSASPVRTTEGDLN